MKLRLIYKNLLLSSVLLFASSANAGGLMITPNRIELDDNSKTQEVRLVNSSKEANSYRISFQNLRMKEDGSYEEIKDEAEVKEKFANEFVKFSPKRVTLQPGESQTIRLLAKKPDQEGEYRSHLLFKEEIPAEFGNSVENNSKNSKELSVVLKPVFAISIPVIVRSGKVESKISFADFEIKNNEKQKTTSLAMKINREGNGSVNGKIVVNLLKKDSSRVELGSISNISVYFPYPSRTVLLNLDIPKSTKLTAGSNLEVKFVARNDGNDSKENEKILAQTNYLVK